MRIEPAKNTPSLWDGVWIEIGAGAGTNGALMAKRGARVSILDYSENALRRAAEFFAHNALEADFIRQDALDLPPTLLNAFVRTVRVRGAPRDDGPAAREIGPPCTSARWRDRSARARRTGRGRKTR